MRPCRTIHVRTGYDANLRELAHRPNVYVKGSEIIRRVEGKVIHDASHYKDSLDKLWELFGEDRVFFGSDSPNSESIANYAETFDVAKQCIGTRSASAQQKYFWKTSTAVYKWKPRTPDQTHLS